MGDIFRYGKPAEAAAFEQVLRRQSAEEKDVVEFVYLFNEDRIRDSEESIFLMNDQTVLALAIIHKTHPCIVSYYTVPQHRGARNGYRLLEHCIKRLSAHTKREEKAIFIEVTSEGAQSNVNELPRDLRSQLLIY